MDTIFGNIDILINAGIGTLVARLAGFIENAQIPFAMGIMMIEEFIKKLIVPTITAELMPPSIKLLAPHSSLPSSTESQRRRKAFAMQSRSRKFFDF